MSDFRLLSCVWEITLACCFSCKYCGSAGGRARDNELTTQECLDLADQLAKAGCRRVSMIGGEVFMRRDWRDIVLRLAGHGIRVAIITNGFLFTETLLKQLKSTPIESIAVSLDGPREVHDRYRQEGSYDRAMRAIVALTQHGIPTSVISTLNAENVQTLEGLYQELIHYPIFAWQLQACSPMGNAASCGVPYQFDPNIVIDFLESHLPNAPFAMGMADNIGYFTENDGYLRGNPSGLAHFPGCQAGLTAIGIDSVGNIRGCESMYTEEFIEGNIRTQSLQEIWDDPDHFAYNRKFRKELLTGGCSSCPHGPYCAGGCRSYNHFVHGKLYEAPRCARWTREE